jgi:transcriptional regulator with XRE-family HTH domain
MTKFESLFISKDQWEKLQDSVAEKKRIPLTRKQFSEDRIKKALKAIRLSQKRLVELSSFKTLLKKHNLKQESYSRETIAKLLNSSEKVSDRDFIEWIEIFMSFFYTELCLFISPEVCPADDPEDFTDWMQNYCRQWEARKEEKEALDKQMEEFDDQNTIISRKKAIVGRWKGEAVQEFKDGTRIPAKVEGELEMIRKDAKDVEDEIVCGRLKYSFEYSEEKITDSIDLYGRFRYSSFLRLNYENCDDFVKQFGAAILELDSTGSNLNGKFVGYGSRTEELFKADVHLKKVVTD